MINAIPPYNPNAPVFRKERKYYEYGSQKVLAEQTPAKKQNGWAQVKTAIMLSFGLGCLAVGVLTKNKI